MPRQLLSLVGRIRLKADGKLIEITNQKARSVLALVCLADSREISRQTLCMMLWPSSDSHRARASLRQTLRRLRLDLGQHFKSLLIDHGGYIRFVEHEVDLDHLLIISAIQSGMIPVEILKSENYIENFLSDLYGLTSDLDSWISVKRCLLQNDIEEALTILLAKNMKSDLVRDAAKALLVIDPTNEVATRKLMRHFAAIGEVAASIRAYDSLYRILEEEFDVEPVQETIELVAEIKLGQEIKDSSATGQEEVPQRIGLDRPTICIVPFQSSSAPSVSNISRSFFRDLLSILIRFREWNVIEGDQRNLHSDYYVLSGIEGTSENGRPILEILLKQAKTGKYLWSERREITHKSWSINHSLIARRVAVAINSNISTDRLVRRGDLTPHTQNAFDRWIHCQDLNAVWSPEAGLEIPKLLKAIIEDEPLFAPAHAELAANYNSRHIFFPGLRRRVDFREQALHHARIALEIDPLDTRSQRVMAWTHLMRNEHDHAEFHFRQALDLNATNPFTLVSSAQGLAFCGKIDHAFELIEDASRLQSAFPKFLNGYLVGINFLNGRYKESVVASRRAGNAISNLLGWEASALWHLGNHVDASETARRMVDILRPTWIYPSGPTHDSLSEWFIDSFPIRNVEQRATLDQGFRAALADVAI